MEDKNEKQIVRELEQKVAELEIVLRRKNFEAEFLDKMIELAEKEYKVDIRNLSVKGPLRDSDNKIEPDKGK